MHRSRARRSSLAALAAFVLAFVPFAAPAQNNTAFWFQGAALRFDHAIPLENDLAVSTRDPGLQRILRATGTSVSYDPGQRYLVFTAADRRTIAFTVGDTRYTVAGAASRAPFAPFIDGGDVVVPLYALARALWLEPTPSANEIVLQPALGALDLRDDGRRTIVSLRAATPIRPRTIRDTADRLEVELPGVVSTLAASRRIANGAIETVDVRPGGIPRDPTTTVAFTFPRGATHRLANGAANEIALVAAPAGVALDESPARPVTRPVAYATPQPTTPQPSIYGPPPPPMIGGPSTAPPATNAPADATHPIVTDVTLSPGDAGFSVRILVNAPVAYEWHRLADHRWYVDLRGATLAAAGRDERPPSGLVDSVRIRQIGTVDAPLVRVALTLRSDLRVDLTPSDGLLLVSVVDAAPDVARMGTGRLGEGAAIAAETPAPYPTDGATAPLPAASPWKFGSSSANPRLIVLDPGHGGGDTGAQHNGLTEKLLTFDIAQRLRQLLVAQGWLVRMTRESDIDPINASTLAAFRGDGKPNPDDRAYLQTRADVANTAGARMFISIHINSSTSSGPSGTTTYYYKPQDLSLAQAVHRALIPALGTQDDGTRKERFYVLNHTTMPAILVETAFLSNPSDAARLQDPSFLQHVAEGIATGVRAFAGAPPSSAAMTESGR